MKKIFIFLLMCIMFLVNVKVSAEPKLDLSPNSSSAYLIEASTMRVIYEKDATKQLGPASMTKIMTMILVMEYLDKGIIKLDDMVTTPEEAKELGGTQIYLEVGEQMCVDDLLKSVAINSANDAAMSLSVYIGGTAENFVNMMNEKAQELGCKNTHFVNSYGFDDPEHYSCARDMAIMGAYLIKTYPKILEYTSKYEDYVREDNLEDKIWLVNTNKLVKHMPGVDGIKTGWTNEAQYNLTATIKKNDIRFIAVAMKCPTPDARTKDIVAMLNYATSTYDLERYLKKGDVVSSVEDVLSKPKKYNVVVSEDVNILKKKGAQVKNVSMNINIDNLKLKRLEEIVGSLDVYYNGNLYKSVDLTISEEIQKASFFDVFLEVLKEIFLVS